MSNNPLWPRDRTLSGAIILGQSRPGGNSNEKVLHISQKSCFPEALPSDCLQSYPELFSDESFPFEENQSV